MEWYKDKKIIGISSLIVIVFIISFITYGKNKDKVFKDEYMKNIFVEETAEELTTVPTATETISPVNEIRVEIKGEVKNPDVYTLDEGSIIKDLIDKAGGLTSEADITKVNRAKKLQNHELIVIGNINDINNDTTVGESSTMVEESSNIISLNTASLEQLKTIPGIGDVKAKSIITYREKNGGFKNIDEIKNIDGIGDKTFDKIKEYISL